MFKELSRLFLVSFRCLIKKKGGGNVGYGVVIVEAYVHQRAMWGKHGCRLDGWKSVEG